MDRSLGQKIGCCREVAVSGRSTVQSSTINFTVYCCKTLIQWSAREQHNQTNIMVVCYKRSDFVWFQMTKNCYISVWFWLEMIKPCICHMTVLREHTCLFAYVIVWKRSGNGQNKYWATFLYYIKGHMQKLNWFGWNKKPTEIQQDVFARGQFMIFCNQTCHMTKNFYLCFTFSFSCVMTFILY